MAWYWLYSAALSALAPFGALYLAARSRRRALLRRFWPSVPDPGCEPIWIHACSVGELNTARGLLRALESRFPRRARALTVSTVSAMELARSNELNAALTWLPFDHPLCVRSFVRRLSPLALVIIETELWPSLLLETARAGVPIILVNGRLSDKHFARYSRYRSFFKPLLACLGAMGMQSGLYAERIESLGVDPARVTVTGNTKFDGAGDSGRPGAELRREAGFPEDGPVVVFGSTRSGDEALAAACWAEWETRFPGLRLVVAPRHIQWAEEVEAAFGNRVLRWSKRSSRSKECPRFEKDATVPSADDRGLILDTLGDLAAFYTIATVAVIGGSFYPGVEGHNPIEAAAAGAPVVFGPYMRNFLDASDVLTAAGGALQVGRPEDLSAALAELLRDESACAAMGEKAKSAVTANQGATERTLDLIEPFVCPNASPEASK